jgi:hypothetical protein
MTLGAAGLEKSLYTQTSRENDTDDGDITPPELKIKTNLQPGSFTPRRINKSQQQ